MWGVKIWAGSKNKTSYQGVCIIKEGSFLREESVILSPPPPVAWYTNPLESPQCIWRRPIRRYMCPMTLAPPVAVETSMVLLAIITFHSTQPASWVSQEKKEERKDREGGERKENAESVQRSEWPVMRYSVTCCAVLFVSTWICVYFVMSPSPRHPHPHTPGGSVLGKKNLIPLIRY